MRRSVWAVLAAMLGMLVVALTLQTIDTTIARPRYHQHLQQPSEAELGTCEVCGGNAQLCTHLPIVRIETGGQKIPGRPIVGDDGRHIGYETSDDGLSEIAVAFSTIAQEGVWHHADDAPTLEGTALMRIRGNSSRYFSKASYRLAVVDSPESLLDAKADLLGMGAGHEWALYGPFLDKTLMRNYMWMNVAGEVMGSWVPDVRFCELLVDGHYQGVYVLMEMIDVENGRLELTRYKDADPICSYLVRIEPEVQPQKFLDDFSNYTYRLEQGRNLELLYPGALRQTQQVKDYVVTDFSEIERMLYAGDIDGWRRQIDVDSFVDYYILEELLAVNDAFSASTYFYRDLRGRLAIGPVWDFNNVLDNFFQPMPREGFILSQRGWFGQLMRDEQFVDQVIRRWRDLRAGVLGDERLEAYVEDVRLWLGGAVDRNFEVWGYSFDTSQLTPRELRTPELGSDSTVEELNPQSYRQAVGWMTSYMTDRAQWIDENIETLRQYCHPSKYALGS